MRMIDADALEKEFCHGCQYENNKYVNCIDCAVANAPTVDAVPHKWWDALRTEINDIKRGTEFDTGSELWFATNHLLNLMDAFEKGGMFYASSD